MFARLTAPSLTAFPLDLTQRDLLADLDPGWLDWRPRPSAFARAA